MPLGLVLQEARTGRVPWALVSEMARESGGRHAAESCRGVSAPAQQSLAEAYRRELIVVGVVFNHGFARIGRGRFQTGLTGFTGRVSLSERTALAVRRIYRTWARRFLTQRHRVTKAQRNGGRHSRHYHLLLVLAV